jgi:hypothetical protein
MSDMTEANDDASGEDLALPQAAAPAGAPPRSRRTLHRIFRGVEGAAELASTLDIESLAPLKSSSARTSGTLTHNGKPLFVKVERMANASLKGLFRKAFPGTLAIVREARAQLDAHRANVPCPKPLALFSESGRAVLVSETVSGETLESIYLRSPVTIGMPADCWRVAARAVAALHRAGFAHRDLHNGNVLIDQSRTTATLVDFANARELRGGEIAAGARAEVTPSMLADLVELGVSLHAKVPRRELARFIVTYLRELRGGAAAGAAHHGMDDTDDEPTEAFMARARAAYFARSADVIASMRRKLSGTRMGKRGHVTVFCHKYFEGVLKTLGRCGDPEAVTAEEVARFIAAETPMLTAFPVTAAARPLADGAPEPRTSWGGLLAAFRGLPHGPYPVALCADNAGAWVVQAEHAAFAAMRANDARVSECSDRLARHGLGAGQSPNDLGCAVLEDDAGQTAWLCRTGELLR